MARQEVDIGIEGNDGTGDSIRESFRKVNTNFQELYAVFGLGGTISFTSLDDVPDTYTGNEHSVPLANQDGTALRFYKFVSDGGTNDDDKSSPSELTNSVIVEFTDPDPAFPNTSGSVKISIVDPHINRDPDPNLTAPLNMEGVIGYSNGVNTKLRNTGVGDNIGTLVAEWNTVHNSAPSITTDNVLISKGYADDTYINVSGDTLTGHLNTISGATGTQVPQVQEVITRGGSVTNRTMLDTLYLSDHPSPLEGFGTPNGADDLQAVTKLYVDTQGFSSTTNLFVSTSGDDSQRITPPGQEGRSQQYAYKTINAAMQRATEIIEATPFEPGPYVQVVTYQDTGEAVPSYISTVTGVSTPTATSQTAAALIDSQKLTIQNNVIAFINTNYPDLVYSEDTCRRDVGLILDSIKLDVQAGLTANYLSRWAGLRYNANPSAIKAKTTQYDATRDGIARTKSVVNDILTANGTISASVIDAYDDRFDEILEYIDSDVTNDNPLVTGNSYVFDIYNGGNASVDQGIAGNKDLIEGKVIRGIRSGAIGVIVDYARAATATTDRITVDLLEPIEFLVDEGIEYGNRTRNNQITIRVESGIYYEHLPIKLPENCSIKGDEFRRVVIRPKPGVSQSTWANTYFYRDINTDNLISAYSPVATLTVTSGPDASRTAGTYAIVANDYAVSGIGKDATFSIVVDGSGAATVTITNGGDGFVVGETITIADSDLGGGGGANLVLTVATTGGGYHFTHPISSKQGKYGYHYLTDPSKAVNVGTSGATNPGGYDEASKLIAANKEFIAEEVIQWIDAQVTAGTGIWSGFVYNDVKCRRDTRLILDGIVNDLKEGGREATLTNQAAYYAGAVAGQEQQTAAALSYIKTIAANVLDNDSGAPFAALGAVPQVFDATLSAETNSLTNLQGLVDCVVFAFDANYNPPLNNSEMDVLLCNDGTIVRNLTVQRQGGFMMVLDPEGQILTRSPYCQTGSSFSQSKGIDRNFAGGLFIDGYAGNMPATIDTVNTAFNLEVSSPAGQGLWVRRPPTPFPFFYNGARYQVNTVTNYNQATGSARLILDETSNEGSGWTGGTGIDIFIQSGGNRSMLANDFTQINDLGFGCLAVNNALSELVSMFTYYCHTGYMAKDGSQIRSIAGNNSYGIYGLVAEGSDPDEIATDVTLAADMVFPAKTFRASNIISFASAIPGSITAGETISQEISGATAIVSFIHNNGKDVYVHSLTGVWNTSDTAYGDDSTTVIGVPTGNRSIDASAATGSLFVYAYDLAGLPNNVSEVEILHDETGSGLYQPYEITNATKSSFILDGFEEVNDTIAATYTGSGPETSKATFTITKDRTNGYGVQIEFGGAGYSAADTFSVSGALLNGTSPANDAVITVSTVDGSGTITGATIAGTPLFEATSPVLNGQVWRFNLGTGIEGTAENGLQVDTPHNTKMVVRHKQNFVVDGLPAADLPVRPSTAFIFTDDYTQFTYRTIAFTNQITDGFTTGTNSRVVTFDSNFRYLDLTTYQNGTVQGIAIAENSGFLTVDPNFTDIITAATPNPAKTLGSLAGDRFIAINTLDSISQGRIADGELIFAWGGKVHTIDAYAEYEYDDGVGAPVTIGVIGITDVAGSDINWPATSAGLGVSLTNTRGITLKGGLEEGEDASITVNISTCRATGHDMLDIGVGGFNTANYPERIYGSPYGLSAVSTNDAIDSEGTRSAAQVQERNKGRVFAVLTDQDGFFRVGRFFTVDQGTGSVTFNAALVLTNIDGIGFKRGVRVNEFSNDDTFSDPKGDAVPTQTAVYGYINYRLGFDDDGNLVGGQQIGPGVMSLGGPGFAQTPMNDNMNLGSNRITNLAAPLTGSDAANKNYVDSKTDELNDIGDVTITPSVGIAANVLGFTGTGSNSENMIVGGDIGLTYTGANSLTASISAGVIVNADVNASAAIAQSKLAMNAATTRANATSITQADLGLASFDSANFEITDGWVGIKAQGVSAGELNNTLDLSGKSVTLAAGEISNSELANSNITVGSTTIALGGTSTTLAGMTGITFSSGNISGVAQISHTGNITGPANSGADNGVSIGSNTNRYNTVWATTFNGTATEALYADLAENYLGDASYEPGTVLVFGGELEVTICDRKGDSRVAGVVTTNPAHLMNSHLKGDHVVGVALTGRVPCKVIGRVAKGDMLVTSAVPGYAIVDNEPKIGTIIGKAVGTKDDLDRGIVEVVVGRL
jgi:hypothetical protein